MQVLHRPSEPATPFGHPPRRFPGPAVLCISRSDSLPGAVGTKTRATMGVRTESYMLDLSRHQAMHTASFILASALFAVAAQSGFSQDVATPQPADKQWDHALFDHVIENQKKNDAAMDRYERIERVETRKTTGENQITEAKVSRVMPAGTGAAHLPVGPDGQPVDQAAYRLELEKLEKSLVWAAETGTAQRQAFDKITKKRKEREDLIGAARLSSSPISAVNSGVQARC
jgi:hypothetical protein